MKKFFDEVRVYFASKKQLDKQVQLQEKLINSFREENRLLTIAKNEYKDEVRRLKCDKGVMRELIGGVNFDVANVEANYLRALSIEEIKQFNLWAYQLTDSRWWKYLSDWIINRQAVMTMSELIQSHERAIFGAGVIAGVQNLREEVDTRANEHVMSNEKPEYYDKYNAIV
jgi:hypothetical protein